MSLTIHHRQTGNAEIVVLAGRLVLGDPTRELRAAVRRVAERRTDLLIDLSGLTHIDSAGLGELVAGYAAVTAAGREIKLLRPSKRVDSLLQITKLYSTFEVFEEETAALASFHK